MHLNLPGTGTLTRYAFRLTAVLLLALSMSSCALLYRDLQPPTVELINIEPGTMQNNLSLTLRARLKISNPNDVSLPIERAKLKVSLNGQAMADSVLTDDFVVPANSSKNVDIDVNVNLLQAMAFGLNLLGNSNPRLDWQLNGYIDVGIKYLGRVYINESGSVN